MNPENPFRKKFHFITPREWFPWVDPSCFEDGETPYMHTRGCAGIGCKRACNEHGVTMGKQYKMWKEGKSCVPKTWRPKRRFSFDDPN